MYCERQYNNIMSLLKCSSRCTNYNRTDVLYRRACARACVCAVWHCASQTFSATG